MENGPPRFSGPRPRTLDLRVHFPPVGPCSSPAADIKPPPDWYCAKLLGHPEVEPCAHCDMQIRVEEIGRRH